MCMSKAQDSDLVITISILIHECYAWARLHSPAPNLIQSVPFHQLFTGSWHSRINWFGQYRISLVGIIQLASVAFPPRRSCLSGLMETAPTVHSVDMHIPYVVFFFFAFTHIDNMWSLHGVGRDNLSLQQMPLFAVGNPSTLQNKEGGGSRLAAARLSSPNSGSFLILSAVVSFQFSLPSYFLPWSLRCYL